jgi:perosamine synthetase
MIVTNNDEWAHRARYLATQAKDDAIEYIHREIGYNYRLTNIQAAMGVAQMEMLDCFIASKRAIAHTYENGFQSFSGILPMREAPWARSAYWMYTVSLSERDYGMNARVLMRSLAEAGIQTRPLWQPLHLSPAHRGAQVVGGQVAEELWYSALSLPCSVGLTSPEQQRVIDLVASNCTPAANPNPNPKNVVHMPVRLAAN